MTTANLQTYFNQWENLKGRRDTTRRDAMLSPQGKQAALSKIDIQAVDLFTKALTAFTAEYDSLDKAFAANEKARRAAMEAERSRWDYSAIEFETKQLKNTLWRNGNDSALREKWEAQKYDGVMVRAWAAALGESPVDGTDVISLRNEVNIELEKIRMTPDIEKVNAKGKELADRAVMLFDDTVAFSAIVTSTGDVMGTANALQRLQQRIKIARKYVVDGFIVTAEMVQPVQDALEALSVKPLA